MYIYILYILYIYLPSSTNQENFHEEILQHLCDYPFWRGRACCNSNCLKSEKKWDMIFRIYKLHSDKHGWMKIPGIHDIYIYIYTHRPRFGKDTYPHFCWQIHPSLGTHHCSKSEVFAKTHLCHLLGDPLQEMNNIFKPNMFQETNRKAFVFGSCTCF